MVTVRTNPVFSATKQNSAIVSGMKYLLYLSVLLIPLSASALSFAPDTVFLEATTSEACAAEGGDFTEWYGETYCTTREEVVANPNPGGGSFELEGEAQVKIAKTLELVDLSEEEAASVTEAAGLPFRVVWRDGEPLAVTMDYRPGRINAAVQSGVVVSFDIEGDVVVPVEDPADAQIARAIALQVAGLSEAEAAAAAAAADVPFRAVERDGEPQMVTEDWRPGRINAVITAGVVMSYDIEGTEITVTAPVIETPVDPLPEPPVVTPPTPPTPTPAPEPATETPTEPADSATSTEPVDLPVVTLDPEEEPETWFERLLSWLMFWR